MAMNKFQTKAKLLEVLGREYERIENEQKGLLSDYRMTDEEEQATQYNRETGEFDLCWEDEEQTIPKMRKKWTSVEITADELDDESRATYDAYSQILRALEKLM